MNNCSVYTKNRSKIWLRSTSNYVSPAATYGGRINKYLHSSLPDNSLSYGSSCYVSRYSVPTAKFVCWSQRS